MAYRGLQSGGMKADGEYPSPFGPSSKGPKASPSRGEEETRSEPRPTAEFVRRHADRLGELWADAFAEYKRLDDFYWQRNSLWPNEPSKPEYHNARAAAVVDHAADTQMPFEPQVHRPSAGESAASNGRADRVEPWLGAVFHQAGLLEPAMPFKTAGKYLVHYGHAVMCGMRLDTSVLSERPMRKKGEGIAEFDARLERWRAARRNWCPFRYSAVNPGHVLLDPLKKQPPMAIVRVQKYAYDLADLLERKRKTRPRDQVGRYALADQDPYQVEECLEFWSDQWHALMLDGPSRAGELLYVERNTWEFQPYVHGYSGWGLDVADARDLNPRYLCKGILGPVLESIHIEQQQQTARHHILMKAAWLKRITRKDPVEAARELEGDILQETEGDWAWERMPQFSESFFRAGDEASRDITTGTYVADLAGLRQQGVSTVGQQTILSRAAHQKFTAANEQLNHFGSILGGRALRLVDVLSREYGVDGIAVEGHRLTPRDVEGDYYVHVSFELADPTAAMQEKQFAMQEYQAGLISKEDYWSVARKGDATGLRQRLAEEGRGPSPVAIAKEAGNQGVPDSPSGAQPEIPAR